MITTEANVKIEYVATCTKTGRAKRALDGSLIKSTSKDALNLICRDIFGMEKDEYRITRVFSNV